jgi:GDSL-like Lipase/Acylhydrolase
MPLRMHSVIVFGDSLSDIGKKWKTKSGKMARATNQMYVSPTGRFSDCRNWTDFMFEAATGMTMIVDSASSTIAISERHHSFTKQSEVPGAFQYANYAEGGACGDTPATKGPFLGTCKDQVDAFVGHCRTSRLPLGNTLFIIWFGANDLYTAKRNATEMSQVAQQIASTQRKRLAAWVKNWNQALLGADGTCKFIFVDLCRPLTAVRYTKRLSDAEAKVRALLGTKYVPAASPKWGLATPGPRPQASHTLQLAQSLGFNPGFSFFGSANEVEQLRAQLEDIKNLENGVILFNATLKKLTQENGDQLAEIGSCVSEDTIRQLVLGNYRLKAGAMGASVSKHISTNSYSSSSSVQHTTTIDQVHPTDQMYRLLWLEIYEQIKRSNCTFGKLSPVLAGTPLTGISGRAPSQQTRQDYGTVMNELLATYPRRD